MADTRLELVRDVDVVRGAPRRWGCSYAAAEAIVLPMLLGFTRHRWQPAAREDAHRSSARG